MVMNEMDCLLCIPHENFARNPVESMSILAPLDTRLTVSNIKKTSRIDIVTNVVIGSHMKLASITFNCLFSCPSHLLSCHLQVEHKTMLMPLDNNMTIYSHRT